MRIKWKPIRNVFLVFILAAIVIVAIVLITIHRDFGSKESVISLDYPKTESRLYCHVKYTGLTGDHRVVAISTQVSGESVYDSLHSYLFYGLSRMFLKASEDTLFIYTITRAQPPSKFDSGIVIVQAELDNVEMGKLSQSWKKMGLIPVE